MIRADIKTRFPPTHGMHRTPEYRAWENMIRRCTNPNYGGYKNYGGRGVVVCTRWRSFAAFLEDIGARPSAGHSLDRIDNDGNYEPKNCRWATRLEQANNTKRTRLFKFPSGTMTLPDAARMMGSVVSTDLAWTRIYRGWSPVEAVSIPRQQYNREKTQCDYGHPLSGKNLVIRKDGSRECRTCITARKAKAWRQR